MMKKILQQRMIIDRCDEDVLEKPVELEYYLIESTTGTMSLCEDSKVYGFGIVQKLDEMCCEEKIIKEYSHCPAEARSMLELLAKNSVTPHSLINVLDDYLGSL